MVNLTRIYTRTGDQGTTRLANNDIISKTHAIMEAVGSIDEANCAIGLALAVPDLDTRLAAVLSGLQNDLFDLGADIATPLDPPPAHPVPRVTDAWVTRLEGWCDEFSQDLPALRSFVLPGGSTAAAALNLARAIVRRAERDAWRVAESAEVNACCLRYLNRASDLLFILGRAANRTQGRAETLWVPLGGEGRAG